MECNSVSKKIISIFYVYERSQKSTYKRILRIQLIKETKNSLGREIRY